MAQRLSGNGTGRYSTQITFEERDSFWWLRGRNLTDFRRLTGLRCDGEAAGLDINSVYTWAEYLAPLGVSVVLARGKQLTTVTCAPQPQRQTVASTAILMAAELLMDAAEREQAIRRLHLSADQLKAIVCNELGKLYVYRVTDELYEIDWELTRLPRASVESLIVAAHHQRRQVSCRLVAPKPQRNRRQPACVQPEPSDFGQLILL